MPNFMDDNLLLDTEVAVRLYHDVAANLPIVDYHCHINPEDIRTDKRFADIAELWLGGDHYKWRLMRWMGVEERFVTGDAPGREKFQRFAEIMPSLAGNPVYHWSHLELKRYFGYDKPICAENAQVIWDITAAVLRDTSARRLVETSNVKLLCTTDDPADSLDAHRDIAASGFSVGVLPAWRPDKAMNITAAGFGEYMKRLSDVSGVVVDSFATMMAALSRRVDYFVSIGCKTSDHSLDYLDFIPVSPEQVELIFNKGLRGEPITEAERQQYLSTFMLASAREYCRVGWVMQLHFSVIRNVNTPAFRTLGPDTGFDCVSGYGNPDGTVRFLNALEVENALPKTVLYALNGEYIAMASAAGGFQRGGVAGRVQVGAAWWFYDSLQGITEHLNCLASQGALGAFIGMLTDSRSLVSYPRHEYFRRILCNTVGGWVEKGLLAADPQHLEKLIRGICYDNVMKYFGFEE